MSPIGAVRIFRTAPNLFNDANLTTDKVTVMSKDSHVDNPNGVGFFGLVGMVVSSCIGTGVFALPVSSLMSLPLAPRSSRGSFAAWAF